MNRRRPRESIRLLMLQMFGTMLLGIAMLVGAVTTFVVLMGCLHWVVSSLFPPR